MPIPDWAQDPELKKQMLNAIGEQPAVSKLAVGRLEPVTAYTTFFAEWETKDNTILLHLFPREGVEDKWEEGRYIPRCRACRSNVPLELAEKRKPCPRCGYIGLIYVPGRREQRAKTSFPRNVLTKVKTATDVVWEGYVAIEAIQELGAVVVQFQDVNLDDQTLISMLEKFFDSFDEELEKL